MLKGPHRTVGLRPKDPVHLEPLTGVARQVAELELLLNTADRVAVAALLDLDDKSRPRLRTDDPVSNQAMARLESLDGGLGSWTEHAVDRDAVPTRPQKILQGLHWVPVVAVLDLWPGADAPRHVVSLPQRVPSDPVNRALEEGCREILCRSMLLCCTGGLVGG